MSNAVEWVKKIYIYLFSAIGLVVVIIGSVQLIDLGLKSWVFTKADNYYNYPSSKITSPEGQTVEEPNPKAVEEYQKNDLASRRQRQASVAISMILVGLPLFIYHWRLARKEKELA